ncbi:hypothetical protein ACE2AJ_08590 [Aquihabitans daechungensis]|uniref:hypothetical protein n=1 Tax=Aquihabitans daechungensis TaxID=1052257 RepID=UPI003BA0CD2D
MSALLLASEGAHAAAAPTFPVLSVLVLTPVVGALVVALISKRRPELHQAGRGPLLALHRRTGHRRRGAVQAP